jgi:hypothetical protein
VGPLQVGATLSQKYKIERLLAESGGAVLYEATDTARKQRVWIKIMQRESLGNAAAMARFQREAAGSKVLDVGKNDAGLPYMVATEFGPPEKPAMPPRPKASKTTLRGVAPPAPPVPSKPNAKEEIEEAAPLSGSDVVIEEASAPVLASPIVTPPLETVDGPIDVPDIPFVEDPVIELPAGTPSEPTMQRKRASAAATVFIDRPTERRSQTGVWIVALVLASIVTGGAGWYFGRKEPHAAAPAATAMSITTTTTTVAAVATTEPAKIPEPQLPTATATFTTPTNASTNAPVTVTTAAPRKPPPNVPRRPAATSRPISGDPLTL